MNSTENQNCLHLLTSLFSQWTPKQEALNEWGRLLRGHSSDTAERAIRQLYWNKGPERAPKPKAFREIINAEAAQRGDVKQGLPEPNAYLICSSADDKGRGVPGTVAWVGWASPLVPMGSQAHIKEALDDHKKAYGGNWICFCGPGTDAMRKGREIKRSRP